MNKFTRVLLLFLLLLSNVNASEEMKITLKHGTNIIKGYCKLEPFLYGDKLDCIKKFDVTLESKYHVFEHYSSIRYLNISTSLYNIYPLKSYANNKSVIHLILSEKDIRRLYESESAKIILSTDIFSENLLSKERAKIARLKGLSFPSAIVLKPTITISLNPYSLNRILKESNSQYSECMKQKAEQEKPLNRLKNYFKF